MPDIKRYEITWGGRPLIIEFNRYAAQANAACTVQYGDTMILATVVMSETARDVDFFPLQVEFKENLYAAGKISGSRFIKREGRPSDMSVLSGRLVDRSIRPLFDEDGMRNDIQVVLNNFSYNKTEDPDIVGLIAASAAVAVSDIPWSGPLAGCTVAVKNGEFLLNAGPEVTEESDINIFVSGRDMETIMLEADGRQASEDDTYKAIEFGLKELQPVVELLRKIQKEIGKPKKVIVKPELTAEEKTLKTQAEQKSAAYFEVHKSELFGKGNKRERRERTTQVMAGLKEELVKAEAEDLMIKFALKHLGKLFTDAMIERIFTEGKRVDDRALDEIRPLSAEVETIPRVHGSGVFQRGDTQVLSIATLSSPGNEQIFDTMRLDEKHRYFHHYNFPPFSVGEAFPMRGPGRREIGHGALAEKALLAVLPAKEDFPYTIRVVSEVLSSNGSSSQGSICGSSLALMQAGVPITAPVAGIAMGIALRNSDSKDEYRILADMQDIEDYDRSMDFKVAGTEKGITAIQLDIKLDGLTLQMVKDTLDGAQVARNKILEVMKAAIAEPRSELSPYAPRVFTMKIDEEKIGELIGPGGKVIKSIVEATGATIDIEDGGIVYITAEDATAMEKAKVMVTAIVKDIEVGEIYEGEVVKIVADRNSGKEIGAIVQLTEHRDGMIHISQVDNKRIDKVSDILKVGEMVKVKVVEIDKEKGRIGLSRKVLLDQ